MDDSQSAIRAVVTTRNVKRALEATLSAFDAHQNHLTPFCGTTRHYAMDCSSIWTDNDFSECFRQRHAMPTINLRLQMADPGVDT